MPTHPHRYQHPVSSVQSLVDTVHQTTTSVLAADRMVAGSLQDSTCSEFHVTLCRIAPEIGYWRSRNDGFGGSWHPTGCCYPADDHYELRLTSCKWHRNTWNHNRHLPPCPHSLQDIVYGATDVVGSLLRRSTRKWSFISRLRTNHGEQEGSPYTPHSTSSASKTRVKIKPHATIKRNYYTQIPDRCKPPSRKPLPLPKAAISTTRGKDTTLDMEEGLGLSSNAAASFPNGDHFTHPSGTASCRESKSEKSIHNFDKSFLHCRTASL